jgi:uncharacterized protein YhbP (UPF0306 family)
MDEELRGRIVEVLAQHRLMTIATNRPDGWPQATTVGYANDGLTLYFLCGAQSQKAHNLDRDDRVSLTIDHDTNDPMAITGLSMAAHVRLVRSPAESVRFIDLLKQKYPEYIAMPPPSGDELRIYRVEPVVISVLDYSKGFGHTDLVAL